MRPRIADRMRIEAWIGLLLCAALFTAGLVQVLLPYQLSYTRPFAPAWIPLAAAPIGAAAMVLHLQGGSRPRLRHVLDWSGLLLLLWTAGGLQLDLLRVASLLAPGLMPPGIDWLGLAVRSIALAALVVLARLALTRPTVAPSARSVPWYGYAAVALALPYPVLKTWWALGGDLGLSSPGADGLAGSFGLWLPAVPWLLAAVLGLLLALPPRRLPRRLLLIAGWSAAVIVAMVGLASCWSLVNGALGAEVDFGHMSVWVYCLIYGSWLLWAIAAAAATRSYQLRTGNEPASGPSLGRPFVDTVTTSRHAQMKELRSRTMRILFAFDPRRVAVLLLGGDKSGRWEEWYVDAVPVADRLFDEHLTSLRSEELSNGE